MESIEPSKGITSVSYLLLLCLFTRGILATISLSICSLFHLIVDLDPHVVEEIGMLNIYLH